MPIDDGDTLEELLEQLADVKSAIKSVLKKQAYSLDGVSYTYADLDRLRVWRNELKMEIREKQLDAEHGTGGPRFHKLVLG